MLTESKHIPFKCRTYPKASKTTSEINNKCLLSDIAACSVCRNFRNLNRHEQTRTGRLLLFPKRDMGRTYRVQGKTSRRWFHGISDYLYETWAAERWDPARRQALQNAQTILHCAYYGPRRPVASVAHAAPAERRLA